MGRSFLDGDCINRVQKFDEIYFWRVVHLFLVWRRPFLAFSGTDFSRCFCSWRENRETAFLNDQGNYNKKRFREKREWRMTNDRRIRFKPYWVQNASTSYCDLRGKNETKLWWAIDLPENLELRAPMAQSKSSKQVENTCNCAEKNKTWQSNEEGFMYE